MARTTYEEAVAVLAENLQALENKLASLSEEDWTRPTRLQGPEGSPSWSVLQLAAHIDFFMGMTMGLVGEAQSVPPALDRASFGMSVSDSGVGPVVYQIMVDHAAGHTPATVLDAVRATAKQALETIRTTPGETVGPAFFGPMRLDEFVPTRVVETAVHGLDLTDAIGEAPLDVPRAYALAAEVLDEALARRFVPGRPADLEGDDLAFVRAATGRAEHSDPRLPVLR